MKEYDLSYMDVVDIKKLLAMGCNIPYVARRFGVAQDTINSINEGRIWSFVKARW